MRKIRLTFRSKNDVQIQKGDRKVMKEEETFSRIEKIEKIENNFQERIINRSEIVDGYSR